MLARAGTANGYAASKHNQTRNLFAQTDISLFTRQSRETRQAEQRNAAVLDALREHGVATPDKPYGHRHGHWRVPFKKDLFNLFLHGALALNPH